MFYLNSTIPPFYPSNQLFNLFGILELESSPLFFYFTKTLILRKNFFTCIPFFHPSPLPNILPNSICSFFTLFILFFTLTIILFFLLLQRRKKIYIKEITEKKNSYGENCLVIYRQRGVRSTTRYLSLSGLFN
jgi:hypothetical protein